MKQDGEIDIRTLWKQAKQWLHTVGAVKLDYHYPPQSGSAKSEHGSQPEPPAQMLMIRLDSETSQSLRNWVASKGFKSQAEAAAFFLGEGLRIHSSKLEHLKQSLKRVEEATQKLEQEAQKIFAKKSGEEPEIGTGGTKPEEGPASSSSK